ncbi:MAG: tRNA lysidine(34) synthetase TilS [Sphingomonas sp.]|nr:tRNA lysidine(34) synthetase TilS [Sphingomonas sp.]
MTVLRPAPDVVARFGADLHALAGDAPCALGVAVSGGPDSIALLLLAHAARPGAVQAATVDHGLRPESAAEAAFVAGLCTRLGVPHVILRADAPLAGNTQSFARAVRYRLLGGWSREAGLACLLTAHHADDQAETLLMRLLRGSGVAGLAGVRARARIDGMKVIRPLLGWRRAELAAVVAGAGISAVDDPSNDDPRYDRARLRSRLREADWLDAPALARSARALAEAEEAIDWAVGRLHAERARAAGATLRIDMRDLPAELRRRLVLRALAALAPDAAPRGAEVDRLLASLAAGHTATLAGIRCDADADVWCFAAAPPRRRG